MDAFNPEKCRYIKNRSRCWEVYNENGELFFTSFPDQNKEAIKTALSFAMKCFEAGFKKGQLSSAFEDGHTEGKIEGIAIGKSQMKQAIKELLKNSISDTTESN